MNSFEEIFISEKAPYRGKSKRDKFLSRVFGIFNEELIRIWCKNENSPFVDLGRPTIYDTDGKHYTLDFLLRDDSGNTYITEMKCEIEYKKYKYFTLSSIKQLKHHENKRAFKLFLENSNNLNLYVIKCNKKIVEVTGSILVWGRVSDVGEKSVKEGLSISHIISAEKVASDLVRWNDSAYISLIEEYETWCKQLFCGLKGSNIT